MDISKRLLKKDELHIIREVADIVWPATFSSILSPEQISYMMEMMYSPAVMEEEFDRGVIFHAVFNNEQPIGYFTLEVNGDNTVMKLHKCYLLPEYQGMGIGSMMLDFAKKIAADSGCSRLRLNVNRKNEKAIRAYTRNGFETVETVDNPIGGGFYMNDYVMEVTV